MSGIARPFGVEVRPVIAEPVPLPTPAPPMRIPLGQVVHLNGAVPRGADLRNALPRHCRLCGALFIVFGKGTARAAYCAECRATKCPSCNHAGGTHYPYCSWLKPRPCRGCGVELGHGASLRQFCEPCWANECPECGVRGGRHQRICLYERRRRRPGLTEYRGVVSENDLVALWVEHRRVAVKIAWRIVGRADAEDIVSEVIVHLLSKREYLQAPPGKAYFFAAVTNGALRRRHYAWSRYVVAVDPEDLVIIEQMTYERRVGGRASERDLVRLPEPVG